MNGQTITIKHLSINIEEGVMDDFFGGIVDDDDDDKGEDNDYEVNCKLSRVLFVS